MNMSVVKPLIFAAVCYAILSPTQSRAQWYNTIDNQHQNAVQSENMRRNMQQQQQYYQMQQQHQQYYQQQRQELNSIGGHNVPNYTNPIDDGSCIGYLGCRR